MDYKQIKQLIKLVEESGISALSIEEANVKIEIKKEFQVQHVTVPLTTPVSPPVQVSVPSTVDAKETAPKDDPNLKTIKSPMVGTFYLTSSPDADPYVKKGDTIAQGDIICIVEAMKLFNEIESDLSGTIEEICVQNKTPVEYGQALFVVRVG